MNGSERLRFVVPIKPVAKARPRFAGHIAYTPKKTLIAEREIRETFKQTFPNHKAFTSPCAVKCRFHAPLPKSSPKALKTRVTMDTIWDDRHNGDIDNLLKTVLDGLNGIAYQDDSFVVKIIGEKLKSLEPSIEIELWEVNC